MSTKVTIDIEQRGDICIVRVTGRLATGSDEDYLAASAEQIKSTPCRRLIADVTGLESIGSAGLGFVVDLHSWARRNGADFVLAGASPRVQEVLDLTGLSVIFTAAPDMQTALGDKVKGAGTSPL